MHKLLDSGVAAGFESSMKSAARFLLLFLSLSPQVSQGKVEDALIGLGAPPGLPVLWDELQGLNELVLSLKAEEVERRQTLRSLESRLRDREAEAERQGRSLDGLEEAVVQQREAMERTEADRRLLTELNSDLRMKVEQLEEQSRAQAAELWSLGSRLNLSESKVDDLKKKNTALAAELPFLQTRLRASESTLEQLRRKNAVLAARLCNSESLMEELRMQVSAASQSLSPLESLPASPAASTASNISSKESKLDGGLKSNTEDLQSRLDDLEEKLNRSAERHQLRETQLKEADRHLDELKRQNTALNNKLRVSEHHLDELQTKTPAARNWSSLEDSLSTVMTQLLQLETNTTEQSTELMKLERKLNSTESLQIKLNNELLIRLSVGEKQLESLKTKNSAALEIRLRSTETHLEQLETHLAAVKVRLRVSEKNLEHLETENTVQSADLLLMESRLREQHSNTTELFERLSVSEKHLEDLKTDNSALELRLNVSEILLEDVKAGNTARGAEVEDVTLRLDFTEQQVDELRIQSTAVSFRLNEIDKHLQQVTITDSDKLKVAFSAGLTDSGSIGPFDEETALIFSKTITNIGQAYNQSAGVFTAPMRGIYYFSFTAADYLKGYMGLYLYRNNQPIIFNLDLNNHGGYASTSNSVALQLEEGDGVHLRLPASYRLYDDSRNFSVFSGFLLFPL
ncbi:putative leucine-rich repeat-containing protein DDB_G0290503 [Channa argus]|uniref:putative leucine-rich repeat-containing protein DDB_G0290503 n=1 Tax=Channa argus TaxID=215402 RepID=UPI00352145F3